MCDYKHYTVALNPLESRYHVHIHPERENCFASTHHNRHHSANHVWNAGIVLLNNSLLHLEHLLTSSCH